LNEQFPLEVSFMDSYFNMMKILSVPLFAALLAGLCTVNGQELDKAEAAEKLTRLAADIEAVQASNATIQKKFSSLNDEIRSTKEEITRLHTANSNSSTQDDLKKLAEKIMEVDRKREADKKLILEEMKNLKETILASLKEMSTTPVKTSGGSNSRPQPVSHSEAATNAANTRGFYEYVVQKGDDLPSIVAAYNETFKSQNKKTITRRSVMDANPNINWNKLQVKQKVLIPVPE
jgi:septal ring factor EnvC (AmiA/AmiB activator)